MRSFSSYNSLLKQDIFLNVKRIEVYSFKIHFYNGKEKARVIFPFYNSLLNQAFFLVKRIEVYSFKLYLYNGKEKKWAFLN